MTPEISVIMPAYNVEHYLERAVRSVLQQSYQDFELLIIEDVSTDRTRNVAERLSSLDGRVRLFCQPENRGMGEARNLGNEKARGKYIFYVDSDDWIDEDALELLHDAAEKNQADITAAGSRIADEKGSTRPYFGKDLFSEGRLDALEKISRYDIGTIVWNKMYRREFIERNKLRFLPIYHEDVIFSIEAAYWAKSYVSLSRECYSYFQHSQSVTHKRISTINFVGYFELMKFITKFFVREGLDQDKAGRELQQKLYFSQMQWIIPNVLDFLEDNGKLDQQPEFRAVEKKYFGDSFYFLEGLLDYFQWRLFSQRAVKPQQRSSVKQIIKAILPYGLVIWWQARKKL